MTTPPRPFLPVLLSVLFAFLTGCADHRIAAARRFNDAHDRGDLAAARAMMTPDARVWYENPTGPGEPWTLGEGAWSGWDAHFHTRKNIIGDYQLDGDLVWVIVDETNDYYRLTERAWSRTLLGWYVTPDDKIRGLFVAGVGEPTSRSKEFREWARANDPAEFDYLMPNGKLDTSGDRPPRMRALLNRWRTAAGLPPIASPVP